MNVISLEITLFERKGVNVQYAYLNCDWGIMVERISIMDIFHKKYYSNVRV